MHIAFDTLKAANRLKAAGFTEEQAAAVVETELEMLEQHGGSIANKRDLKETELLLKKDIETIRLDMQKLEFALRRELKEVDSKVELLRADTAKLVAEAKAELVRWVVGVGLLQSSVIIGVLLKVAKLI